MKQLIGNLLVHAKGYEQDIHIENDFLIKEAIKYFVDDCEFFINTPYGPDALIKVSIGKESKMQISYYGVEHAFPLGITRIGWTNDLLKGIITNLQQGVGYKPHHAANKILSKFTNNKVNKLSDTFKNKHTNILDTEEIGDPEKIGLVEYETQIIDTEEAAVLNSKSYLESPKLLCGLELTDPVAVIEFFKNNEITLIKLVKNYSDNGVMWFANDDKENIWVKKSTDSFFFNINY